MKTIISISGVDYDGGPTGWALQGISGLELTWDLESDSSFSFSVYRICGGYPPYAAGVPIAVDTTEDDDTGRRHVFVGDLQHPQGTPGPTGIVWNYTASGLKRRANYVSLTALDGTGTASFNLAADDPLALYATGGQTVGNIVRDLLCQVTNATLLDAAGVGAYTSLSPPTLPAVTLADLANLTVVPPQPVQLRGESILNTLEQFILQNHEQFCLYVLPDGTIRVRSIFALTPQTVALPSSDGSGDDVDWPQVDGPDVSECYTAWQISGLDIQSANLSTVQGTLRGKGAGPAGSPPSGWTAAQESAWTIADFLQPKNASDDGACSSVTSTSASVHSDYPGAHWPTNFWDQPDVQGWIWFFDLAGAGIDIYENKQITSCTALAAGGSATVTWDTSNPLNSTAYTRYRIAGNAAPMALVGREFYVREPATGDTGVDTYVGSHMYPRNPRGMPVANNSRAFNVFYPYAMVQWSRTGAYPWWEVPVRVQINPLHGSVVLAEPAVLKSASLAGTVSALQKKYPTTFADGLYYNVQVVIPYNRGALSARWPASGFRGTAFSQFGIQRTFVQHIDSFNWNGDTASLQMLAEQHLRSVQDAVLAGSINYYELPTGYDVFTPGFCLRVSASGSSTPLDGLDMPVRSATIRWHEDPDPVLHSAALRFSNKRRPFEGDDRYIHPALGRAGFGMQTDEVMGPGGMMGLQEFNAMSAATGQERVADMLQRQRAAMQLPTMESIAAQNAATMGGINANADQIGANLAAQAHPGDAFAAANAPFAQELQRQAGAAQSGDPFGVMQGMGAGGGGGAAGGGDGRPTRRDASGMLRSDAEKATGRRHDEREKAQEKAAGGRHREREAAQQRTAQQAAAERQYEKDVANQPTKDAMEARKEREQQQKEHGQQIRAARERGLVGPKEPLQQKQRRQANERGQQKSDAEFGPLGPSASGSGDVLPFGNDDTGGP